MNSASLFTSSKIILCYSKFHLTSCSSPPHRNPLKPSFQIFRSHDGINLAALQEQGVKNYIRSQCCLKISLIKISVARTTPSLHRLSRVNQQTLKLSFKAKHNLKERSTGTASATICKINSRILHFPNSKTVLRKA